MAGRGLERGKGGGDITDLRVSGLVCASLPSGLESVITRGQCASVLCRASAEVLFTPVLVL